MDDAKRQQPEEDELLPEYDFSQGVRGRHFREYQQGYTVMVTYPAEAREAQAAKSQVTSMT